ncbi:hypothetical protein J6S88_07165 [bacterium]|nr:hypothetical protein [bacterium]
MNITNNNQISRPNFKQITITPNGQKAIDRIPFYKYAIGKDLPIANRQHPTTKYWDLVIDGEKEYDKYLDKFIFSPVFKFISKITGETFENLHINPPTSISPHSGYVCSSKHCKYLPPEVLLLSSNDIVTDAAKVKELMFNIKDNYDAEGIWEQYLNSTSKDIYVYKALENMSDKYESSLKIGVEEFLKTNPKFQNEMEQLRREQNYVWFSDGSIDQWT